MGSQRLDNINKEEVQALQNLKVLDLTRVVAGPYGASILGDFGADVLKIEMPGNGDDARGYGSYEHGESVYYANLNRNKRGITLNLKSLTPEESGIILAGSLINYYAGESGCP